MNKIDKSRKGVPSDAGLVGYICKLWNDDPSTYFIARVDEYRFNGIYKYWAGVGAHEYGFTNARPVKPDEIKVLGHKIVPEEGKSDEEESKNADKNKK